MPPSNTTEETFSLRATTELYAEIVPYLANVLYGNDLYTMEDNLMLAHQLKGFDVFRNSTDPRIQAFMQSEYHKTQRARDAIGRTQRMKMLGELVSTVGKKAARALRKAMGMELLLGGADLKSNKIAKRLESEALQISGAGYLLMRKVDDPNFRPGGRLRRGMRALRKGMRAMRTWVRRG